MADAVVSDVVRWKPYEVFGDVYWPAAAIGAAFWPRRHFDQDNIIGPYAHYSIVPNLCEIDEGWGLNQIIAVAHMLRDMHSLIFAIPPDLIEFPVTRAVDRFPTENLWWAMKNFIDTLRSILGLSSYAWTFPYGDFADDTKKMAGKQKISFVDLTEFRDALGDVKIQITTEPVTVVVPGSTVAPWTGYTMFGDMTEPVSAGVVDSTLKNTYHWRFTSRGSSAITPFISGVFNHAVSVGIGLDQYTWTGNRVIFQFPACFNTTIAGFKLRGSVRRNAATPVGSTSIVRVFAPPEDPSLIGLSNAGALGSPLQNGATSSVTLSTKTYTYRPHSAPRHRIEIRPSTPLSMNGAYWPDHWPGGSNPTLNIGSYGSSLLTAVSFSNVDLSGFNRSVNVSELPLIIYMGGVTVIKATAYFPPDGDDVRSSFVLLLGQDDPCENGLWFFELDDLPGNLWLRKWQLSPGSLIPNVCYQGMQSIFGWPNTVNGEVWWLTDQPPEFEPGSSSSSSLASGEASSLYSSSCGGNNCDYNGYQFRQMTAWEKRFMNIYDTPLLGTEVGSFDTASIPDDGAYHDIELNLTGFQNWVNTSAYFYLVMAIDMDLTKPKPGVNLATVGVNFIPQLIIPQV